MTLKITLLAFISSSLAFGQLQTPKASPTSKLEQTVGLTTITVEYSRPSKNDRIIFGDLIKFDEVWRTGANENTTITLTDLVIINHDTLKAGKYALYTKPMKDSWEVYFYSETSNWGTPEKWEEAKVALKLNVPSKQLQNSVETFTIDIQNLTTTSAEICLKWDKTAVHIPFTLTTNEKVEASIKKLMNGPSSRDYYAAANYYLGEKKELPQALTWMKKAVEMEGTSAFWMYRKLALIHAELGDYSSAIQAAKISIEGAEKASNNSYVEMNKVSITEWNLRLKKK